MRYFKIFIFAVSIFSFTGCAFIKAQINSNDEMTWNELFDNKNWEPVNKNKDLEK